MAFAAHLDAFARALLEPGSSVPEGITTARGEADAARFAVYRNNVHAGLTRALSQRFPVTEQLVGTEFFRGMARAYAHQRKPASPLIFAYGDDFPDFVGTFPPAAALAYLPDVARLEAAWTDAYHAADAVPLTPADLAAVAPELLGYVRLAPHPATRLIRSGHPAGSIWARHHGDASTPIPDWGSETVLVARPLADVRVHVLPASDAGFAAALLDGTALGEAAQMAGDDAAFDFGTALVGLVSLGAFCAIDHGDDK